MSWWCPLLCVPPLDRPNRRAPVVSAPFRKQCRSRWTRFGALGRSLSRRPRRWDAASAGEVVDLFRLQPPGPRTLHASDWRRRSYERVFAFTGVLLLFSSRPRTPPAKKATRSDTSKPLPIHRSAFCRQARDRRWAGIRRVVAARRPRSGPVPSRCCRPSCDRREP